MTPCLYHESRNSIYKNEKFKLYKCRNSLRNIQIPEIKKYKLQEYRDKFYKNNKIPIIGIQRYKLQRKNTDILVTEIQNTCRVMVLMCLCACVHVCLYVLTSLKSPIVQSSHIFKITRRVGTDTSISWHSEKSLNL